jgi:hypothetical protein
MVPLCHVNDVKEKMDYLVFGGILKIDLFIDII